jgi:hypothetical protein
MVKVSRSYICVKSIFFLGNWRSLNENKKRKKTKIQLLFIGARGSEQPMDYKAQIELFS